MRCLSVIVMVALAGSTVGGCERDDSARLPKNAASETAIPEVIVFHHALGVTEGIQAFAEQLRAAGHRVVVPDLFGGKVFDTIDDGVAHAEQVGFEAIIERGLSAVGDEPRPLVVIGFSLGVMPAQKIAQNRPSVRGAVLCHSAVPYEYFGAAWPQGVALQLHLVEQDPWAAEDLEAARQLVAVANAELHLYQGTGHLVAEPGHADYDAAIAEQILQRVLVFLAELE